MRRRCSPSLIIVMCCCLVTSSPAYQLARNDATIKTGPTLQAQHLRQSQSRNSFSATLPSEASPHSAWEGRGGGGGGPFLDTSSSHFRLQDDSTGSSRSSFRGSSSSSFGTSLLLRGDGSEGHIFLSKLESLTRKIRKTLQDQRQSINWLYGKNTPLGVDEGVSDEKRQQSNSNASGTGHVALIMESGTGRMVAARQQGIAQPAGGVGDETSASSNGSASSSSSSSSSSASASGAAAGTSMGSVVMLTMMSFLAAVLAYLIRTGSILLLSIVPSLLISVFSLSVMIKLTNGALALLFSVLYKPTPHLQE